MQRSCRPIGPRSWIQPPGVGSCVAVPRRSMASAACRFAAAAVIGGIRPFGGSVISDVRRLSTVDVPPSSQKLL